MKKIDNRFLIIAFILLLLFFIYFTSGVMDGGTNGMNHNNGWMRGNNWGWFPSIVALSLAVAIGWLYFKRKK